MRKYIFWIIGAILAAGVTGTGLYFWGKREAVVQEEHLDSEWYIDFIGNSYGNSGMFYREDGYLHFADVQSGYDVLVCDNGECTHAKEECSAYFDANTLIAVPEKDQLWMITDYGSGKYGTLCLYEASMNGENRKKLAVLGSMQNVQSVIVSDKYIIIGYYNIYDENMNDLDVEEAGVYVYDRESRAGECVWKINQWNARIFSLGASEDKIYFSAFYYDLSKDEVLENEENIDFIEEHRKNELYCITTPEQKVTMLQENVESGPYVSKGKETVFFIKDGRLICSNPQSEDTVIEENIMDGIPCYVSDIDIYRANSIDGRGDGYQILQYTDDMGKMDVIGTVSDYIPIAVFPDVTYSWCYDSEDGSGRIVYWKTDDFLDGQFENYYEFERLDGKDD